MSNSSEEESDQRNSPVFSFCSVMPFFNVRFHLTCCMFPLGFLNLAPEQKYICSY